VPSGSMTENSASTQDQDSGQILDVLPQPAASRPRTQLQDNIVKPKKYMDGTIRYDCLGLLSPREPQSLLEALTDVHWKDAMDEEFLALMKNKTWHLVPPQQAQNIVDCKWVYKVKQKSNGSID
jgi:hypothetical protein